MTDSIVLQVFALLHEHASQLHPQVRDLLFQAFDRACLSDSTRRGASSGWTKTSLINATVREAAASALLVMRLVAGSRETRRR